MTKLPIHVNEILHTPNNENNDASYPCGNACWNMARSNGRTEVQSPLGRIHNPYVSVLVLVSFAPLIKIKKEAKPKTLKRRVQARLTEVHAPHPRVVMFTMGRCTGREREVDSGTGRER